MASSAARGVLALAALGAGTLAHAADSVVVTAPSSVSIAPGSSTTVDFTIDASVTGLTSFDVLVLVDTAKLSLPTLVGISASAPLPTFDPAVTFGGTLGGNGLRLSWSDTVAPSGDIGYTGQVTLSFAFTAANPWPDATPTTITLDGNYRTLTGDAGTSFGTSVNVSAVPEPATWALTLAGVAVVGGVLRRRSTRPSLSA